MQTCQQVSDNEQVLRVLRNCSALFLEITFRVGQSKEDEHGDEYTDTAEG